MIAVPHYISPQDYLDIERQSQIRHEYRRGLVYAMAGGTDNHDRIAFNLLKIIDNHFGDSTDCRFHSGNVKVNFTLNAIPNLSSKSFPLVRPLLIRTKNSRIINRWKPWKNMY